MRKVARLGYVEEEPDEILGEKPYLHCLGRGGRTDQMDEMRDVVASATAATAELPLAPPRAVSGACPHGGRCEQVIAELLLDEDKLPVAFDPFFTGLGVAIGPNRKHGAAPRTFLAGMSGTRPMTCRGRAHAVGTVTCIHLAEEWEDDDDVPDIFGVGMCRCCVSGKGIIKLEVEFVPCSVM